MRTTIDRSNELALALIEDTSVSGVRTCRYVPLSDAPEGTRALELCYVRQMHTVASCVAEGLLVRRMRDVIPTQWDRLSRGR